MTLIYDFSCAVTKSNFGSGSCACCWFPEICDTVYSRKSLYDIQGRVYMFGKPVPYCSAQTNVLHYLESFGRDEKSRLGGLEDL